MVVALGPGRFYGSSLPRPRFYSDVKLSNDGNRVDPPLSVLDPLLSWAKEAHWSMGGFSFDRRRLQGRIEGSVKLLRVQEERKEMEKRKRKRDERSVESSGDVGTSRRKLRKAAAGPVIVPDVEELPPPDDEGVEGPENSLTPFPHPAPTPRVTRSGAVRRKRLRSALLDDDSDEGNACESVATTPLFAAVPEVVLSVAANERASDSSPRLKKKRARKLGEEFDRLAAVDSPIPSPVAPVALSIKRLERKTLAKDKGKAVDSSTLRKISVASPVKSFRRPRLTA